MTKCTLPIIAMAAAFAQLSVGTQLYVGVEHLGGLLTQVIQKYLDGCHLVLLTTNTQSSIFSTIYR